MTYFDMHRDRNARYNALYNIIVECDERKEAWQVTYCYMHREDRNVANSYFSCWSCCVHTGKEDRSHTSFHVQLLHWQGAGQPPCGSGHEPHRRRLQKSPPHVSLADQLLHHWLVPGETSHTFARPQALAIADFTTTCYSYTCPFIALASGCPGDGCEHISGGHWYGGQHASALCVHVPAFPSGEGDAHGCHVTIACACTITACFQFF